MLDLTYLNLPLQLASPFQLAAPLNKPPISSSRGPLQQPLFSSSHSSPAAALLQQPLFSSNRSSPAAAPLQQPPLSSSRPSPSLAPAAVVTQKLVSSVVFAC